MISKKLVEQLKIHEGFSRKPYKDTVGKLTIGYGRNLDDNGINRSEGEFLLFSDLVAIHFQLKAMLPGFEDLNETRQNVLLNMAYNMGIYGLLTFKNMLRAISERDFEEAAKQALNSKWAQQVGGRALELAEQLKTGIS